MCTSNDKNLLSDLCGESLGRRLTSIRLGTMEVQCIIDETMLMNYDPYTKFSQ